MNSKAEMTQAITQVLRYGEDSIEVRNRQEEIRGSTRVKTLLSERNAQGQSQVILIQNGKAHTGCLLRWQVSVIRRAMKA
jgi:hypothetical protein